MSKSTKSVKVKAVPGEILRYQVESWGRADLHHIVDLMEQGGNGECGCTDFRMQCTTNWKENGGAWVLYGFPGHPDPKRTQCRHIYCARMKFTNDTLKLLSKQQAQPQS